MKRAWSLILIIMTLNISCSLPTSSTVPNNKITSPSGEWELSSKDGYPIPGILEAETADRYWQELQACTGMKLTLHSFGLVLHGWKVGQYPNGTIYLYIDYASTEVGGWTDPYAIHVLGNPSFVESWKHEMLHVLLREVKHNVDIHHTSSLWLTCTTK